CIDLETRISILFPGGHMEATKQAALFAGLIAAGLLLTSCEPEPRSYQARIRRTAFGVPHIVADDYGSLGFGQGYAFAEDNACVLADQILKLRGERASVL